MLHTCIYVKAPARTYSRTDNFSDILTMYRPTENSGLVLTCLYFPIQVYFSAIVRIWPVIQAVAKHLFFSCDLEL